MSEGENDFDLERLYKPLTTKKGIWWLVFLGFLVFSLGLFNGFVIDDGPQVGDNVFLRSLGNIPNFFRGSTFYTGGQLVGVFYRPIPTVLFSFIVSIFGTYPFWFHLFQLLFHVGNSIIIFLIFSNFLKKRLAFIFSLIFLVHPAISESVFYISAMHEVLFVFFGLLALFIVIKMNSIKSYSIVGLLLTLSVLSKETGFLFFLLIGLFILIFRRKEIFNYLFIGVLSMLLFLFFRFVIANVNYGSQNAHVSNATIFDRLITMPSVFWHYLQNFLFPLHLSSSYQWIHRDMDILNFFIPLILVIIVLIGIFFVCFKLIAKKTPESLIFIFFALWFLLGISAHLHVVPLDATAADRWFYFPIIGLLGMVGSALSSLKDLTKSKTFRYIMLILIVVLSTRTAIRAKDWRDDLTLAVHDIKVTPDSHDIENRLAVGLVTKGQFRQAQKYAENAAKSFPSLLTLNTLGAVYLNLGEYEKSQKTFNAALKYGDFSPIYENLILIEILKSNYSKAKELTEKSLVKFPSNAKLWMYLAISEYQQNDVDGAREAIYRATQFSRDPIIEDVFNKIMSNKPLNIK